MAICRGKGLFLTIVFSSLTYSGFMVTTTSPVAMIELTDSILKFIRESTHISPAVRRPNLLLIRVPWFKSHPGRSVLAKVPVEQTKAFYNHILNFRAENKIFLVYIAN
jgi:hypothetical protein